MKWIGYDGYGRLMEWRRKWLDGQKNLPPSAERKRMRGITHDIYLPGFHHGTCPRRLFAKFSTLDEFFSLYSFFFFFDFWEEIYGWRGMRINRFRG